MIERTVHPINFQNRSGQEFEHLVFAFVSKSITKCNVDNGQKIEIQGSPNPNTTFHNGSLVSCKITISFIDSDGNKYLQVINKNSNQFEIEDPYDISLDNI